MIPLPLLVLFIALASGTAEVAVLAFRQQVLEHTIERSRQFVWLVPLSYLLWLSIVALGLAVAGRLRPRLAGTRLRVSVLAGFGAFGLGFLFYPMLAKLSIIVLAIGVGMQAGWLAERYRNAFTLLVRRSTPALALLVVGLAAGINARTALREWKGEAAIGQADEGAPNILLVIFDTVRASDLSTYGYDRPTSPVATSLAGSGVRFDRAYATAPWTLPSHVSLFTGFPASQLRASWDRPMSGLHPTLAEVLRDHGWATAGFVGNFAYCSYEHGLDRGFVHYEDYHFSPGELIGYSSLGRFFVQSALLRDVLGYRDVLDRRYAPEINAELLHWLDGNHGRPFFAFLNYYDAHIPYVPQPPYDTLFGQQPVHARMRYWLNGADRLDRWQLTPGQIRQERAAYDAGIAEMDHALGELLGALHARGLLENTIVVLTADHGEQFGEHGLQGHGNSLYLPLLHVPLIVSWPGHLPPGRQVATDVSLRDLPATLLDLALPTAVTPIPGASLSGLWLTGGSVVPSPVRSSVRPAPRQTNPLFPTRLGDMASLVRGGYHYIRAGNGDEELYDLASDSSETLNLAPTPVGARLLPAFRELTVLPTVNR